MADLKATGLQIPNLSEGQARPADAAGFIRMFSRNQRLFGRIQDGTEFPLTGTLPNEVREIVNVQRPILLWPGSGTPTAVSQEDDWLEWNGAITSSGGTLTFNVTTNGLSNGPPIFANLAACIPQVTTVRDTDSNNESPWAHVRRIEDNRRVIVQVKRSNQGGILLGGTYSGNLNNSNSVTAYLTLKGVRA